MRSLRGRLTLGVTVVLAAVLVLAGWLAARDVDRSEREALDERLVRTAELSGATALEAGPGGVPRAGERARAGLPGPPPRTTAEGPVDLRDRRRPLPGLRRRPAGPQPRRAGPARADHAPDG